MKAKTMKQYNQELENITAKAIFDTAMKELKAPYKFKRLRSCDAKVYETENFFILKSFQTFIAAIDKRDGKCSDVLRYVYGYTRCSASQIAKFQRDYTPFGKLSTRYTYRDI